MRVPIDQQLLADDAGTCLQVISPEVMTDDDRGELLVDNLALEECSQCG